VTALCLWFFALGHLPLATAMTLNYMSSVWMALFLVGAALTLGRGHVDTRAMAMVLVGFAGVALILRPTMEQNQLWHGLVGLLSGMIFGRRLPAGQLARPRRRTGVPHRLLLLARAAWPRAPSGASGSAGTGHTPGGIVLLLAVGALATAAQILMTRAYSIGRPLVNASLQYLGIAFLLRLRGAAVRRPDHLDGRAGHDADRRRGRAGGAVTQPAGQHTARARTAAAHDRHARCSRP
jgi:S-adenosylmethionine uptake transporter